MKKILTAAAALLLSVATFAQSNDSPPPPNAQQTRPMRAPMSPEQRAKRETDQINSLVPLGSAYQRVLDVNNQFAQKRESITGGTKRNGLTEDQRSQLKQLNHDHEEQLKAAMGPDLFGKYKAAEKARREERRSESHDGPQGPPPGGNDQK